jgi:uncharacterized protein (DUF1684 family)
MMATARALGLLVAAAGAAAPDPAYRAQIEDWRRQREERLKADGGWLSVAGLYWLEAGANSVGTATGSAVLLPAGSAPPRAGVIELAGGRALVRLEPGVQATLAGAPLTGPAPMRTDHGGAPDELALGRLRMTLIERSGRVGVRLKDPESPQRKAFSGLRWYPVREDHRVTARFTATTGKTIPIPNVLGQVNEMASPGYVVFTLGGREHRLEPVLEDPEADELFFIFRDATAGTDTYPAGRFLYTPVPKDGQVVLDFNKAYSPPCAFTRFATCPLPPKENRLATRVEAGEKDPRLLH